MDGEPRGALALVLLLDQFTRNIYRDTARMFAGDARALQVAEAAVAAGFDGALGPYERSFLYLPFEHAEDSRRAGTLARAVRAARRGYRPAVAARMGGEARGR